MLVSSSMIAPRLGNSWSELLTSVFSRYILLTQKRAILHRIADADL